MEPAKTNRSAECRCWWLLLLFFFSAHRKSRKLEPSFLWFQPPWHFIFSVIKQAGSPTPFVSFVLLYELSFATDSLTFHRRHQLDITMK